MPDTPIRSVTGQGPLACVAVPTIGLEAQAVEDQLWLFEQPAFAPFAGDPPTYLPILAYIFNNRECEPIERRVRSIYKGSHRLQAAFAGVTFDYLDLEGEQNLYQRDYSLPVGEGGYKAGPNNQFFGAMRALRGVGRYALIMETDCIPIRRDWLGELDRQLAHTEPFWVMGSFYRGLNTLDRQFRRHLNGNAVYAVGDPSFQAFLDTVWEPELRKIVKNDRRIAYDCAIELLFEAADSSITGEKTWRLMQEIAHKFRLTGFLQNRSGRLDAIDTAPDLIKYIRRNAPETYLLHGKAFADAAALLRKSASTVIDPDNLLLATEAPLLNDVPEPRVLVLDMTRIGDGTATGEVKRNLFEGWPGDRLLQIYSPAGGLGIHHPGQAGAPAATTADACMQEIERFQPEVILYRPVPDTMQLHAFAMKLIRGSAAPLVTWIMDDWPQSLARRDPEQAAALEADLRFLLARSAVRLSISDQMSAEFKTRYALPFSAVANGVDPSHWPEPLGRSAASTFLLRYSGGLAPNMGLASLVRVAEAVQALAAEGVDIRLEIRTQPHWRNVASDAFTDLPATHITWTTLTPEDYRAWLAAADALVIAYNFDEQSLAYVRHSRANKLPECLASGAALLAHGPLNTATLAELARHGCGLIVDEPDPEAVKHAVRRLVVDEAFRRRLAATGQIVAFNTMDVTVSRAKLFRSLRLAAGVRNTASRKSAGIPARAASRDRRIVVLSKAIGQRFDWSTIGDSATMVLGETPPAPPGWRPTYFVGLGEPNMRALHRVAIMFDEAELPRRCLIGEALADRLGSLAASPKAITLSALRPILAPLRLEPVSSVSHGILWAATMGFGEIVLAGSSSGSPDDLADGGSRDAWEAVLGELQAANIKLTHLRVN